MLKLESVPWCAALIQQPRTVTYIPPSRLPKANVGPRPVLDKLFSRTLWTDEAIPECLGIYQDCDPPLDATTPSLPFLLKTTSILFDLREGVNGFNGTAHGGFISALMDESMGSLLYMNDHVFREKKADGQLPLSAEGFEKIGYVTSGMNVRFLAPVKTPQIVVVSASIVEVNGRRVHIRVVVKGEHGTEYATCDGTWISVILNKL